MTNLTAGEVWPCAYGGRNPRREEHRRERPDTVIVLKRRQRRCDEENAVGMREHGLRSANRHLPEREVSALKHRLYQFAQMFKRLSIW